MVKLKQSWQHWHYHIVKSLWKTLLGENSVTINIGSQQSNQHKGFLVFLNTRIPQDQNDQQKILKICKIQHLSDETKFELIYCWITCIYSVKKCFIQNRKFLQSCFPVLLKVHCLHLCSPPAYVSNHLLWQMQRLSIVMCLSIFSINMFSVFGLNLTVFFCDKCKLFQ